MNLQSVLLTDCYINTKTKGCALKKLDNVTSVNFQKKSFFGNSVCLLKKSVAIATLSTKMANSEKHMA